LNLIFINKFINKEGVFFMSEQQRSSKVEFNTPLVKIVSDGAAIVKEPYKLYAYDKESGEVIVNNLLENKLYSSNFNKLPKQHRFRVNRKVGSTDLQKRPHQEVNYKVEPL